MASDTEPADEELALVMREARELAVRSVPNQPPGSRPDSRKRGDTRARIRRSGRAIRLDERVHNVPPSTSGCCRSKRCREDHDHETRACARVVQRLRVRDLEVIAQDELGRLEGSASGPSGRAARGRTPGGLLTRTQKPRIRDGVLRAEQNRVCATRARCWLLRAYLLPRYGPRSTAPVLLVASCRGQRSADTQDRGSPGPLNRKTRRQLLRRLIDLYLRQFGRRPATLSS